MKEISDIAAFEDWAENSPECEPAAVQDLDLGELAELITSKEFPNSIFLSCDMDCSVAGHVVQTGGVVIPDLKGFEFQVHRKALYSVDELFDGFDINNPDGYEATFDFKVYKQYYCQGKSPRHINTSLARRLHDHSITDALDEELKGRKVVAVMGGHGMERQDSFYVKVAKVSRLLTRAGFLMVSGGGPGAMEATHLGAYFASRGDEKELEAAIAIIKKRPANAEPGKEYEDKDWLHRAWRVREKYPIADDAHEMCKSIGIPTWFYGHEPPAPFATQIAKYFANSVREDGLLAIANHGVIFAPGSAGTTQEVFQDAAQNHYGSQGVFSPMIMFGEKHWTETRPVWPLLAQVAKGKQYGELIALTDSEDEIVRRIKMFDPEIYKKDEKPRFDCE
jgi:predicted Rossmann-fold nucleotide-binding protein